MPEIRNTLFRAPKTGTSGHGSFSSRNLWEKASELCDHRTGKDRTSTACSADEGSSQLHPVATYLPHRAKVMPEHLFGEPAFL